MPYPKLEGSVAVEVPEEMAPALEEFVRFLRSRKEIHETYFDSIGSGVEDLKIQMIKVINSLEEKKYKDARFNLMHALESIYFIFAKVKEKISSGELKERI